MQFDNIPLHWYHNSLNFVSKLKTLFELIPNDISSIGKRSLPLYLMTHLEEVSEELQTILEARFSLLKSEIMQETLKVNEGSSEYMNSVNFEATPSSKVDSFTNFNEMLDFLRGKISETQKPQSAIKGKELGQPCQIKQLIKTETQIRSLGVQCSIKKEEGRLEKPEDMVFPGQPEDFIVSGHPTKISTKKMIAVTKNNGIISTEIDRTVTNNQGHHLSQENQIVSETLKMNSQLRVDTRQLDLQCTTLHYILFIQLTIDCLKIFNFKISEQKTLLTINDRNNNSKIYILDLASGLFGSSKPKFAPSQIYPEVQLSSKFFILKILNFINLTPIVCEVYQQTLQQYLVLTFDGKLYQLNLESSFFILLTQHDDWSSTSAITSDRSSYSHISQYQDSPDSDILINGKTGVWKIENGTQKLVQIFRTDNISIPVYSKQLDESSLIVALSNGTVFKASLVGSQKTEIDIPYSNTSQILESDYIRVDYNESTQVLVIAGKNIPINPNVGLFGSIKYETEVNVFKLDNWQENEIRLVGVQTYRDNINMSDIKIVEKQAKLFVFMQTSNRPNRIYCVQINSRLNLVRRIDIEYFEGGLFSRKNKFEKLGSMDFYQGDDNEPLMMNLMADDHIIQLEV